MISREPAIVASEGRSGSSPGSESPELNEATRWQTVIKQAVRDPLVLCRLLELPERYEAAAVAASRDFPVFVPQPYLARMRRRDVHDPLLRQVLPLAEELASQPGYTSDPLAEQRAAKAPGLIQKYPGRVLMVATGVCAVHCRYCFRRHYPYGEAPHSLAAWLPALDAIAADDSIREVILSGGDPWMLADELLAELTERLAAIAHLRRLRVHTRLPVMVPARVTGRLLETLTTSRLTPVVVLHANHPAELDAHVGAAVRRLLGAGILVLNQSVLLRGVNDSADVLAELSERLVELGALPYYLHQLDPVLGARHFLVPVAEGKTIIRQLRSRLPGYAVPRYAREVPGETSKVVLA